MEMTKKCSKCGEVKLFESFGLTPAINQNKSGRVSPNANTTGRVAQCKKCRCSYSMKYQKEHRDQTNAQSYKWAKENPEKRSAIRKAQRKKHRQANHLEVITKERAYNTSHAKQISETRRKWMYLNQENIKDYKRENKQKSNEQERVRYANNPHKSNAKTKFDVETLKPFYLANLITRGQFPANLVPPELIETKREQLQLYRLAKKLTTAIKTQKENP